MIKRLQLKAMPVWHRLSQEFSRLGRCERGAVIPLFLVSAGVIFAVTLGGIDLARHASASTRLQNALDGAALAAGRLATENPALANNTAELLKEARLYFRENFPEGYLGTQITPNNLRLKNFQPGQQSLTFEVDSSLRLLVTGFLDVGNAGLQAESTVSFGGAGSPLEVVFAVDVTAGTKHLADNLQSWAENQLKRPDNTMALGIVPFSEMVNVGTGANQKKWVQSWRTPVAADIPQHRLSTFPTDYVENEWTGCIAEPEPWKKPDSGNISPLSPTANFMPLFVRVNTSFYGNTGAGKAKTADMGEGWKIYSNASKGFAKVGNLPNNETQPRRITPLASPNPRRLLWFTNYEFNQQGGDPHSSLHVFSVHEPLACQSVAPVRFLESRLQFAGDVAKDLGDTARVGTAHPSATALPPVGLLWAWRMLSDAWRGDIGWSQNSLTADTDSPSRAIVLITSGNLPKWSDLTGAARPTVPWVNGEFHFDMEFYECTGGCKDASLQTHSHAEPMSAQKNGWQRPVSSIAMKHPFKSPLGNEKGNKSVPPEDHIDFSNWPSISTLTSDTCEAITAKHPAKTDVKIFVLSMSEGQDTDQALRACASTDGSKTHFYTSTQVELLKQELLSLQTGSSTLRLTR